MRRRGSKGIITTIVIIMIIIMIALLLRGIIQTNMFDTNGEFILSEANKVTVSEFEKECKYYGYINVVENQKEFKDAKIYYIGTLEDIKYGTFGGCTALLKVTIPKDELEKASKYKFNQNNMNDTKYGYIIVTLDERKHINASKGDYVKAYGTFSKINYQDDMPLINMHGIRINEQ